ncbi:MAG: Crp/Fnr family transcriptional regulator [Proteobacteria bacterium]|nr:Crp/Fnr family transcriptional regulator [Pseudomonadota bacterium]
MRKIEMLGMSEFAALFRRTVFASLDEQGLETLRGMFERYAVERGEYLRRKGEGSSALYVVESGRIDLMDGMYHSVLGMCGEGECVGLLSLWFPGVGYLDACAAEPSAVLSLDEGAFRMLEFSDPKLVLMMMRCIRTVVSPKLSRALEIAAKLYQEG